MTGGALHILGRKLLVPAVIAVMLVGLLGIATSSAHASHIDLEQRRAERAAEREARRAEREAEREARRAERNQDEAEQEEAEPDCTCRTSLRFDRPDLRFNGGVLTFVPRVDINIRSRGDHDAPAWTAVVNYEGSAAFESEDITVPADTSFSGSRALNGGNAMPCGGTFRQGGFELPAVPLTGITNSLVGLDQELDGTVGMTATLAIPACQVEEVEARQFHFNLEDLFDLSVRGWRSIR